MYNQKLHKMYILTRTCRHKGMFTPHYSCPEELASLAVITLNNGVFNVYHRQPDSGKGIGTFNLTADNELDPTVVGYF